MTKLTKKQRKELCEKSESILDKTTRAFTKLEKEYGVKNISFSGIHVNRPKSITWATNSSYSSN